MTWPALSVGSQPPQLGRALGPPAVVQVVKAEPQEPHLLIIVAACAAKGGVRAELEYLPYFLFVNHRIS